MSDNHYEAAKAADALVEALWPRIEELSHEKGAGALPAAMTLAKPFVRAALSRIDGVELPKDKRTSTYRVSAMFWELRDGDETDAELVTDTDSEGESTTCDGLPACVAQLALWIAELHEGEELSEEANVLRMTPRVPSLRVSLARGDGVGQFRVRYEADGIPFLAHATVRRIEGDEAE